MGCKRVEESVVSVRGLSSPHCILFFNQTKDVGGKGGLSLNAAPSEREKDFQMRQTPPCGLAVQHVMLCLIMNPYRHLIRRWNYKSACLSALSRGTAILLVNLSSGGASAAGAMLAEVLYRVLASGFYSSAIQSFRYARPFWGASVVSLALIPVFSETLEFFLHRMRGTQRLGATILVSTILTAISTLLELLAMRRGVLTVGKTSGSLIQDLKILIRIIGEESSHLLWALSERGRKCSAQIHRWKRSSSWLSRIFTKPSLDTNVRCVLLRRLQ